MKEKLAKIRARLLEIKAALDPLDAKETLTADDIKSINDLTAEAETLEAQQAALTKSAETRARFLASAGNVRGADDTTDLDDETTRRPPAEVKDKIPDGVTSFGLAAMAVMRSKRSNGQITPLQVLRDGGFPGLARQFETYAKQRAIVAGNAAAGGLLIPEAMSTEIIEFLRPSTAFLRGNPRRIPMPNGSFNQPGGATGASATYGTELSNAEPTQPTFRDIDMTAKELKALVPMSNMWLDFSIAAARGFVEADLRMAMSETLDLNAFTGDGVAGRPTGIFNVPGIGSGADTYGTAPTYAQTDAAARAMLNYLVTRNVNISSAKWVMGAVAFGYLQDLRDGNGNLIYPSLSQNNPTWKTLPVLVTTNQPENLGGTGDEGKIGLIAFDHVLFGEAPGMEFSVSTEAAYYDANAVLRSAFQRGETLLLTVMRHDFGLRHLPAVYVRTGVRWGK